MVSGNIHILVIWGTSAEVIQEIHLCEMVQTRYIDDEGTFDTVQSVLAPPSTFNVRRAKNDIREAATFECGAVHKRTNLVDLQKWFNIAR